MRKIIGILTLLTALSAALSCQRETPYTGTPELEDGGISLTFLCNGQETKVATMPGEDEFNENTLTTIDYFLYPEGQTGEDAYLKGRVTMDGRTSFNVLVNTSQLSQLFNGATAGAKCDVYAIANYPGATTDFNAASDTTTLHNLAISNHFNSADVQTNFVMSGHSQVTVINKNKTKAAEGTVRLNRAASKVTFECHVVDHVDITNTIYSDGEIVGTTTTTWVPLLEQMGAYLVNGYADGNVGGTRGDMDSGSYYRYSQRSLTDADNDGWYTCNPFYTYPQEWHSGDENEPFIKLVVPWGYLKSEGEQAGQKQFYYKVPCPGLKMDSNTWYHIKLDVAILGGDDFEATLDVEGEYYVLPWNTQTIVRADAEIKDARYISSPSNVYNMYNVEDLDVLITSSHDAEINLKSVTYYDFKNGRNTDYTTTARNNNWITYDDVSRTFSINHALNNDITDSAFDTSPYVFTFEIRHVDDHNYTTGDIVVTQYPAMYIKAEESNGYVFVNNSQDSVNQIKDSNNNSIGVVVDPSGVKNGTGDNNNTNQYTVYVTTLPSDSPYVIGDPRIGTVSNVTTLNGLSNNYKPTAENTQNVISPVFKIASSYGKTSALWYDNAKTRCAAYQENGYPAGRWRLPTKAEIEFLVSLSEKGKIPSLFTVDRSYFDYYRWYYISYYWAGGNFGYGPYEVIDFSDKTQTDQFNNQSYYFSYNRSGDTTNYHSVYTRCVYDTWFWGESKDSDHMTTWGGYQTTQ